MKLMNSVLLNSLKVLVLLVVIVLVLIAGVFMFYESDAKATTLPLVIIQPPANGTTSNAFYQAYPGMEYNRKVSALFGELPYTYTLLNAPSGMVIDASTGVISWPNPGNCTVNTLGCTPTISSAPVTVRVTDVLGTQVNRAWSINVTTARHIFLDANNGAASSCNGGTNSTSTGGKFNTPFKTIGDFWCGSKVDSTFQNVFVIYRSGTYNKQGWVDYYNGSGGTNKPMVHICYPGETCTLDLGGTGMIHLDTGPNNFYLDGFNLTNITNHENFMLADASNVTFRRNRAQGGPCGTAGALPSLFITEASSTPWAPKYWSITENSFIGLCDHYVSTIYAISDVNFEYNTIDGSYGPGGLSHGFGIKGSPIRVDVKNNLCKNGVGTGACISILQSFGSNTQSSGRSSLVPGDYKIRWNKSLNTEHRFVDSNSDAHCGGCAVSDGGGVEVYSNTATSTGGGAIILFHDVATSSSKSNVHNNVILGASAINCVGGCSYPSPYLTVGSNITGSTSSGIINLTTGNLTTLSPCVATTFPNPCNSYATTYGSQSLGTTVTTALSPPANARVQ